MEPGGDSIVLEEEIDPNYEPTEREVQEYASWLGMDLETEQDLFWVAREGLKAPLPENWKPCKTTDTEEIYYFNFATGQSTWDHPCDEYYRKVYDDHKKKRSKSRDTGDADERKKKEKEDVAELLGKKAPKKKKASLAKATAEPLGPPMVGRGVAPLSEKKPLPGLSGSKLNRLSSGNLGSTSSLKPVASLGRLKSEAKEEDAAANAQEDKEEEEVEESERKPTLHKPPLGGLLTKKPLPSTASTPSLSKVDSTAELDALTTELAAKKQRLMDDHAKAIKELEEEQERKVTAQEKELKSRVEELEEEQDAKLKQRRRELEKKLHDVENQFDKDESNLLRERKEKLKKLEADLEQTLSLKRQELERDQQKELQRLQSKHNAAMQDLTERSKQLQVKGDALAELATATERVKTADSELESLRGRYDAMEKQLNQARRTAEELEERLRKGVVTEPSTCLDCERQSKRVAELEVKMAEQDRHAEERILTLQKELEDARVAVATTAQQPPPINTVNKETEDELAKLQRDLASAVKEKASIEAEASKWKSQCGSLEKQAAELQQQQERGTNEEEDGALRGELVELQEQVAVLSKTNAQIKEQLLKESTEKRQLREQLDALSAASGAAGGREDELQRMLEASQREHREVVGRLATREDEIKEVQAGLAAKEDERVELERTLRSEKQASETERRRVEEDLAKARSESRQLVSEVQLLQRQMNERLAEADESQATAATATKLKWEIEQLQGSLQNAQREKHELTTRVEVLTEELEEQQRRADAERESEAARARKKEAEREALQLKLKAIEEEAEAQSERVRGATTMEADLRAQVTKVKFKEQAAVDKIAQLEEELRGTEGSLANKQSDLERLSRELRAKMTLVEDKTAAIRALEGEAEALEEQLQEARRQVNEWRSKANAAGGVSSGGATGGEILELRLRVSEQEARLDSLTAEKTQATDRLRQLTQRFQAVEAAQRSAEDERDRVAEQLQQASVEATKWRDRLEKKTKEAEQLKLAVGTAQSELEETLQSLSREREEKKDALAAKLQLHKAKTSLETQLESLASQVHELETAASRAASETQALQSKLRRAESEMEAVARELRVANEDREAIAAKLAAQTCDSAALESKLRALRSEHHEQSKLSADEHSRSSDVVRKLESVVEERDARLRKETEEKEAATRQLSAMRSEKEELSVELLAARRKCESAEARLRELESTASRGDFALKLRVQQLEAERDGLVATKERLEQQSKTAEKELMATDEALASCKSELEASRARVKALTSEKEEMQQAVLQQSTRLAVGLSSATTTSASADALLVKLQLADVTKGELEQHVAELATQLEVATRRYALAEARGKDLSVESESLRVEIASLRAAAARMHASALETLPLIERLEYERRKRVLTQDFAAQLRDFCEREEHALLRQKARVRAVHEKQLAELGDELELKKRRRVEYEEQVERQVLEQLRRERDVKAKELRQRIEAELAEEERVLEERKQRQIDAMAVTARREEEEQRARTRELQLAQREEELVAHAVADKQQAEDSGHVSPGQLRRGRQSVKYFDESDSEPAHRDMAKKRRHQKSETRTVRRRSRSVDRSRDREIQRWKKRVADEAELLDKVRASISDQRRQLTRQVDQIKREKQAWKEEAKHGSSGVGHRGAILHEMKAMIDQSAAQWTATRQQLKQREAWLSEREAKLRKMRRALAALTGRSSSRQTSRTRRRSRGRVRFDSDEASNSDPASHSSGANGASADENQDVDSEAILEKLSRLDGELASDASEFSSEDGRVFGFNHAWSAAAPPPVPSAAYRYPLVTASLDGGYASVAYAPEPLTLGPGLTRFPSGPLYTAGMTPRAAPRVWPSNASSRLTQHRSGPALSTQSDATVQRRIARWAQGRETMQHAATKQATWLSGLYQEVKAYGDAKADAAAVATPVDRA